MTATDLYADLAPATVKRDRYGIIHGPSAEEMTAFRNHPTEWTGYRDVLPMCDVNPEPERDHDVPSVSTIKGVWPKFLTRWYAEEAAKLAWHHRDVLPTLSEAEALALIAPAAERSRDSAASRGHAVHETILSLLTGQPPSIYADIAMGEFSAAYEPAIRLALDDLQPTPIAHEVVVFGDGFSGTFDWVWDIGGELVGVDAKSRKPGKATTRSEDEGAQCGAYFGRADYWIVQGHDDLVRMAPIKVARAMILSIAPDGYARYDIDLDTAGRTFDALREFHAATVFAKSMFARAKTHYLPKTPETTEVRRIGSANPIPKPAAETWAPDEGADLDIDTTRRWVLAGISRLARDADHATEIAQRIAAWAEDGKRHRRQWAILTGACTERRKAIHRAAARLAAMFDEDPDALDALTAALPALDVQPAMTVGGVLGALSIAEAAAVVDALERIDAATTAITFDDTGRPQLRAV